MVTYTDPTTTYIKSPVPYVSSTSKLPAGASAYTSTVSPSGNVPGTVIYGQPSSYGYTTTTFYTNGIASPTTSTSGTTVVIVGKYISFIMIDLNRLLTKRFVEAPYVTLSTIVGAGSTPFTSTISSSEILIGTLVYLDF